ncbi:hypothetical protein BSZ35_05355 [Salinibacter sp. 10B]|uniref:nuclear transport factor 2 family protein n=1 Tax=Salinibacter sp. 10B TaxID=1923971 RepID=UPI000CF57207|nr:nuclear transport factor 2 family protein [Salinibacter sp. 10B]PQJ34105.1 hypothetical protein BSZ35_05355 [Salinibacter sp. 10B]
MARLLLLFTILLSLVPASRAQSGASPSTARSSAQEVRATIDALFDAMRAGDSAAVRGVFHPNARLHTALGADTSSVQATQVEAFASAVGRPHEEVWDERVWDVEIRIDGPLASAWVPYVFYLGEERSHCGVNALQLVRHRGGWRILQLTDTRRQKCAVPAEVQK